MKLNIQLNKMPSDETKKKNMSFKKKKNNK
jgi:hypothetical protein